jgi:hypothetical protein
MRDFPLPIADEPQVSDSRHPAWRIEDPEPTNLITLWPGEIAPTFHDVLNALQSQCRGEIEIVAPPGTLPNAGIAEQPLWLAMILLPEDAGTFETPLVIWAEPMRELSPENIRHLKAESIKWAVGMESVLNFRDPCTHILNLLRVVGRGVPESPAILDVNKEGWHLRQELDDELLPEESAIAESLLWFIHAVGTDPMPNEKSKVWIYTNGLHRCGLPELEMLDVPFPAVGSAMQLLNAIGELIVEDGPPAPGRRFEVGNDLAVTLHPWQDVAATIDEAQPGHVDNREGHSRQSLTGIRAVVCAAEPVGGKWLWPEHVVRRLAVQGETALYRTRRSTARQAQLARSTWPQLAEAFAITRPELRQEGPNRQAVFLVKAGIAITRRPKQTGNHAHGVPDREDLWFEVERFHGERAQGKLVNSPLEVTHLREGDTVQIDRGIIKDWQVLTKRGNFGPGAASALREALPQLNGAPA